MGIAAVDIGIGLIVIAVIAAVVLFFIHRNRSRKP